MDEQHVIHVEDQVFGSNRERIGTVVAVTPYYLHVASGLLGFGHNYYIPYDAVKKVETGMVVLKVPTSRVSELGWEQEPGEPAIPPRFGHYGTMPAPPVDLTPLAPSPPPETPAALPPEPLRSPEPAPLPAAQIPEVPAQHAPRATSVQPTPPQMASICGHKLCDVHGNLIGRVRVVNPDHVEVCTGLLGFGPTLYVPLGNITRCEGDLCYVDLTQSQIDEQDWDQKPDRK